MTSPPITGTVSAPLLRGDPAAAPLCHGSRGHRCALSHGGDDGATLRRAGRGNCEAEKTKPKLTRKSAREKERSGSEARRRGPRPGRLEILPTTRSPPGKKKRKKGNKKGDESSKRPEDPSQERQKERQKNGRREQDSQKGPNVKGLFFSFIFLLLQRRIFRLASVSRKRRRKIPRKNAHTYQKKKKTMNLGATKEEIKANKTKKTWSAQRSS